MKILVIFGLFLLQTAFVSAGESERMHRVEKAPYSKMSVIFAGARPYFTPEEKEFLRQEKERRQSSEEKNSSEESQREQEAQEQRDIL